MSARGPRGPAARVLAEAASRNAALGHENLGPLSESHGFLARRPPQHDLLPPHDAWVEALDELPELCSTLRVRPRLEELPLLDASAAALDDRHLLRAASVLGLLAHAYSNVPMRAPERLPETLVRPWLQTAERLERPAFTLSNSDYIFDNWRLVDAQAADPMRVENLRVLNPIWDHPQMDTFILVLVELLAQSAPLVGSAVRAQDACLRRDDEALEGELALMGETVRRLTRESLTKISANARAGTRRVDPVLWTKLFAMLPLPVQDAGEGVRNASGAETPYFHLLDVVLGRRCYDTQLGHEAIQFRQTHPPHWREFIAAVGLESIADYVRDRGDRDLSGLFSELADAYQGRHGLLARHRLKAFAYMEASFKTGRSSTVTGFSGLFEDRTWETVDASFEAARLERVRSTPPSPRLARVVSVEDLGSDFHRVVLDVRGMELRCEPGDRCALLPENESELVERTLRALGASGHEHVQPTREWADALSLRPRRSARVELSDVLTFGHIRPVPRAVAKLLFELSNDGSLRAILEAHTEDQWELWDLVELLTASGFGPERLRDPELVCRIVPPLEPRSYFVSSVTAGRRAADRIELTVERLSYESIASPTTVARHRRGVGSTYLCRAIRPGAEIPLGIAPPASGFALPSDTSVPIVMLGHGIGVAPFLAFLETRARTPGTQNLLFAGAPTAASLPEGERLLRHAALGEAELHVAPWVDHLLRDPVTATRLRELIRPRGEGGAGATLYVCGDARFARSMMESVADLLAEPGRPGQETLADLIVRHRYLQEVLPTHTASQRQIHASELARHNEPSDSIWAAISGRVYDLTSFAEFHPGGQKLIHSFAGMDATSSYRIVEHHRDQSIDALLSVFEIGVMRRLRLEEPLLGTLFRRWARSLYVLVEIENAHRLDTSIRAEPLRRHEVAGALARTPYRLQFALEAHRRFLGQTLPILCRRFGELWQATSEAVSAPGGEHALVAELERLLGGPEAEAARHQCDELERLLETAGATAELDARLTSHQTAERAYLRAAKTLVAAGVRAFELHETLTLAAGREALLDALRTFPSLTLEHLEAAVAPQHAAAGL